MFISENSLSKKNNNFDVLRLSAAILVFVSHTYVIRGQGNDEILKKLSGNRYSLSTIGLIIFFSMSGFLVCRSLVTAASIKHYLYNRFLRIWPAYFICILVCILTGLFLTALPAWEFLTHQQTLLYFFKNSSLLSTSLNLPGISDDYKSVNPSIWTIPIEVRLYLLLLFIYLIPRLRFKQTLLILLITVWAARLLVPVEWQHNFLKGYIISSINLGSYFLAGACFYLYKHKIPLKFYSWLLLFGCLVSLHIWFPGYTYAAELPLFVYSIMWIVFRWKTIPFMKADLSYGFYLYGSPVQIIIQYSLGQQLGFSLFLLVTVICAITMAGLSWYLIEKKALSLKPVFRNKKELTTV